MVKTLQKVKKNINWTPIIPLAVEEAEGYIREFKEPPTLRAVYYRLVSKNHLPNTKGAYKGLSRVLTKARHEGTFPWNYMVDNIRKSTGRGGEGTIDAVANTLKNELESRLSDLESSFGAIKAPDLNWVPSRWAGQENRVLVCVEKDAMLAPVRYALRGHDVEIFPTRGYSSTTFMKQLADRVHDLHQYGDVKIKLLTDYDPSGEDIARDIEERLRDKFGVVCEAEKLMITKEQIIQHDLPTKVDDAEEVAKLMRDPRWDKWTDGMFRVELDALPAINPEAFKKIMQDSVLQHFNGDLYTKQRGVAAQMCIDTEDEIKALYGQLETVHEEVRERIEEIRLSREKPEDTEE